MTRLIRGLVGIASLWLCADTLGAQGVSTSGIEGAVGTDDGSVVEIHARVRNESNGFTVEARAAHDRFLIEGLEPGGPYTVSVRALGFVPVHLAGIRLALGERREVRLVLHRLAVRLDTVAIADRAFTDRVRDDGGTATTITDSLIDRLPTLNRDLYDFLRLVPQISTQIGLANPGISAAGMSFRLNNFLINGVSERTLSGGVSNAFGGVRSVPLDAVREYQALLGSGMPRRLPLPLGLERALATLAEHADGNGDWMELRYFHGVTLDSFARSRGAVFKGELAGLWVLHRHLGPKGYGTGDRFDFHKLGM